MKSYTRFHLSCQTQLKTDWTEILVFNDSEWFYFKFYEPNWTYSRFESDRNSERSRPDWYTVCDVMDRTNIAITADKQVNEERDYVRFMVNVLFLKTSIDMKNKRKTAHAACTLILDFPYVFLRTVRFDFEQ